MSKGGSAYIIYIERHAISDQFESHERDLVARSGVAQQPADAAPVEVRKTLAVAGILCGQTTYCMTPLATFSALA